MYLLVCSFALTIKAFKVGFHYTCFFQNRLSPLQNIPNEVSFEGKTTAEIIVQFFEPPVGALIAAMISTYGIYLVASFLYVSFLSSVTIGTYIYGLTA